MNDTGMLRWLAQKVLTPQESFRLSILTVEQNAAGQWRWSVKPFEGEMHSTVYYNGTIRVIPAESPFDRPQIFFEPLNAGKV